MTKQLEATNNDRHEHITDRNIGRGKFKSGYIVLKTIQRHGEYRSSKALSSVNAAAAADDDDGDVYMCV